MILRILLAALLLALPLAASAAPDMGAAISTPAPASADIVTASPQAFSDALTTALGSGQYRLAIGLLVIGLVWLLRGKVLAQLPGKVGSWFATDRAGILCTLAAGALAVVGARLLASGSMRLAEIPGLLINSVAAALVAAGGWSVFKKWPSTKPDGSKPVSPPGVGLPLCLVLLLSLTACNPRQVIAWQALRSDAAGCLAPGAKAAMAGAVDNVIKELSGVDKSVDWKSYGIGLAANYGGSLALCIIAAAIERLGPVILGGEPAGSPRPALHWLDAHRDQWIGN